MQIGTVKVFPLLDGITEFPPALLYPEVSPSILAGSPGFLNAAGNIELPNGGFLVRGPAGEVVLFDLGNGPDVTLPKVPGFALTNLLDGQLLANLDAYGVSPADVTDVVFTHLHADHVGWASRDERPTFPAARHHIHARDWKLFVDGDADPSVRAIVAPLVGLVDLWDAPEIRLYPWLRLIHAPGHTPGSAIGLIESERESAMLVGDVFHSLVEVEQPALPGGADTDANAAAKQREQWAARIEAGHAITFCPHFPDLAPVTIVAGKAVPVPA
ncbi:MBL fold metallo-hydrolase [Kribbella sp. DT2]|uniref:MBL fold metallo-hydrolase n=1 Tax=Kribbella sp. DT2 TaxID=3393427 RepID=UPI003CEB90A5